MNERLMKLIKLVAFGVLFVIAGIAAGGAVMQTRLLFAPDYRTGDYRMLLAKQGPQVAIYGTSWCTACSKARETLDALGVEYSDFDIETSDEAKQKFMSTGESAVPLIIVQDRMFIGVDESALKSTISNLAWVIGHSGAPNIADETPHRASGEGGAALPVGQGIEGGRGVA